MTAAIESVSPLPAIRPLRATAFLVALSTALALTPRWCPAEKVVMKNGIAIEGVIVEETDSYVKIRRADSAATLRLNKDQISEVVREEGVSLEETKGDRAFDKREFAGARDLYRAAYEASKDAAVRERLKAKIDKSTQSIIDENRAKLQDAFNRGVDAMRTAGFRSADPGIYVLNKLREAPMEGVTAKDFERQTAMLYFAKAQAETDRLQYSQAIATIAQALTHDSEIARFYLTRGDLIVKIAGGQQYDAIDDYLKGLSLADETLVPEERAKYHYQTGMLLFEKKRLSEAIDHLLSAASLAPGVYKDAINRATDAYLTILSGEANILALDEQSVGKLKEMIALNPHSAQGVTMKELLASIYFDRKQYQDAIATLSSILPDAPGRVEVSLRIAKCWERLAEQATSDKERARALAQAEKAYRDEIAVNPYRYDAYCQLGRIYEGDRRFDEAEDILLRAIRLEPRKWEAYYQIIFIEKALGDGGRQTFHDQARAHIDELIQLRGPDKPESYEALALKAAILMGYRKYEEAIPILESVQKALGTRDPASLQGTERAALSSAHNYRGYIAFHFENLLNMAEGEYLKAIEVEPKNADAHANLGEVYKRLALADENVKAKNARYRQAEKEFARAIELDPDNAARYLALGYLYYNDLRELDKARDQFVKYQQLGGTDPAVADVLANIQRVL